ncbi:hypothetical protein K0A97_00955 [Patescibacteria group bacterium]|nr:hypothetical protein [Patescibacteria group bacterium]
MGLFSRGKKDEGILDLSERYKRQKERENAEIEKKEKVNTSPGIFSFFDRSPSNSPKSEESNEFIDLTNKPEENSQEKRRRLAKRLSDMTGKIEDLSNKIYHLEQRLEVLEKKNDIRNFD